jgi:hypothetical protein
LGGQLTEPITPENSCRLSPTLVSMLVMNSIVLLKDLPKTVPTS